MAGAMRYANSSVLNMETEFSFVEKSIEEDSSINTVADTSASTVYRESRKASKIAQSLNEAFIDSVDQLTLPGRVGLDQTPDEFSFAHKDPSLCLNAPKMSGSLFDETAQDESDEG